jgi:hypothetical protein
MYVIISKKDSEGTTRGYKRENNHVVSTAKDEIELENKINELANEGEHNNKHTIIQVLWKNT